MSQLINEQDMDLSPLVFVFVLLMLAVAEPDLRPVPELEEVLGSIILDLRCVHPGSQEFWERPRAGHVILEEIIGQAPEQVDLNSRDCGAQDNGCDSHQVRLATASCSPIQDLSGLRLVGFGLLRVQR